MSEACCWPEMMAVNSWTEKHGYAIKQEDAMELMKAVTEERIKQMKRAEEAEKEREQLTADNGALVEALEEAMADIPDVVRSFEIENAQEKIYDVLRLSHPGKSLLKERDELRNLLETHEPHGHNYTNQQYVDLRARCEELEGSWHDFVCQESEHQQKVCEAECHELKHGYCYDMQRCELAEKALKLACKDMACPYDVTYAECPYVSSDYTSKDCINCKINCYLAKAKEVVKDE